MAETFALTIKTPSATVYNDEADSIHLKTEYGKMEVFPGHAPLQGTIGFSRARVKKGSHEENFLLRQGFIFIDPDDKKVRVLAYAAQKSTEMDHTSAKDYMDAVLAALEKKEDLNQYQLKFLEEEKIAMGELLEETKNPEFKKE